MDPTDPIGHGLENVKNFLERLNSYLHVYIFVFLLQYDLP